MSNPIVVYDLCGRNDIRFSPACWYVKLSLALKHVQFSTQPTSYSEIRSVGSGQFSTLPVYQQGKLWIGDSWEIICYLENTMLQRPLFKDRSSFAHALYARAHIEALRPQIAPLIFLDVYNALQPQDQAYFRASREQRIGMSLEQAAATTLAKLPAVAAQMQHFDQVLEQFHFLDGDSPGYADIHLLGLLLWVRSVSKLDLLASSRCIRPWLERYCSQHFPHQYLEPLLAS